MVTEKKRTEKIKVFTRPVTRQGNILGYRTNVNGKKYFCGTLYREIAIERALERYYKEAEDGR